MADSFIGYTIEVRLKHPPGAVLQGKVANVVNQTLGLVDVFLPSNGQRLPAYNIHSSLIADLQIVQQDPQHIQPTNVPSRPTIQPDPTPIPRAPSTDVPTPTTRKPAFVDPAIVSFSRKPSTITDGSLESPAKSKHPQVQHELPSTPIKGSSISAAVAAAAGIPARTSPFVGVPQKLQTQVEPRASQDVLATLSAPFSALDVSPEQDIPEADDVTVKMDASRRGSAIIEEKQTLEVENRSPSQLKKARRGGRGKKGGALAEGTNTARASSQVDSSPDVRKKGKKPTTNGQVNAEGWRQTPLLEQANKSNRIPGVIGGSIGLQAVRSSDKKNRRQRALGAAVDANGWATEDTTDIQELGDFDFQANLNRFDKKSVFDEIRNEDTTADEDRLVSFNKIPTRPGTYGGKNLHPSENVLEQQRRKNSGAFDSDDDSSERDSGRNSKRAMSRTSMKRHPLRKDSGLNEEHSNPMSASGLLNRSKQILTRANYSSSHATGSPKPGKLSSPPASPTVEPPNRKSALRLLSNERTCPTLTPTDISAIEELAEVDLGLTEDMTAETAARGIAEVALSAINPGGRRLAKENPNSRPVMVVLAGNHKGGSRAIAAARLLSQRGLRVMVCVLGYDSLADLNPHLRKQIEVYRKFGGHVGNWANVSSHLKKLDAPPELIIDALLGRGTPYHELGFEDQSVALELIGWANKSKAHVLAVDCPSGVNGLTGEISILEGEPLEVRAKFIVCLTAPRTGLLHALRAGEGSSWQLSVVDIGLNKAWKRHGAGGGKVVKFGSDWVVQLGYKDGEE